MKISEEVQKRKETREVNLVTVLWGLFFFCGVWWGGKNGELKSLSLDILDLRGTFLALLLVVYKMCPKSWSFS